MTNQGHLAAVIRTRRAELMLSQAELASAAGISESTIRAVESGRRTSLRASNRRAIAAALGWQPGSIDIVLDGGHPIPADPPDQRTIEQRVAELEAEIARLKSARLPQP